MRKNSKVFYINSDGEFAIKVKEGLEIYSTAGSEKAIKITVKRKEQNGKSRNSLN